MEAITPAPNNFVANLINGAFEDLTSAFDTLVDPSRNTAFTNVKTFGAVGNGINDDTTAIQNALNSGGTIYFPAGTYLVSQPLTTTNTNIIGNGQGNTIIKSTITSGVALTLGNYGLSISDIQLLGTYSSTNQITATGLLIQGNGTTTTGMMASAYNLTVYNFGVGLEIGDDTWLNKFYNCQFGQGGVGVNFSGTSSSGENYSFYGGVINDNTTGVEITAANTGYDIYFFGTSFDYNTNYIFNNNGNNTGAINFVGCHFEMDPPTSAIAPIVLNAGWAFIGGELYTAGTWTSNAFIQAGGTGALTNFNVFYPSDIKAIFYNGTNYYLVNSGTFGGVINQYYTGQIGYISYTPSASPYTLTFNHTVNSQGTNTLVIISGGAISSITFNGVSLATTTQFIVLTPSDTLVIDYTSAPTIYYEYM